MKKQCISLWLDGVCIAQVWNAAVDRSYGLVVTGETSEGEPTTIRILPTMAQPTVVERITEDRPQ